MAKLLQTSLIFLLPLIIPSSLGQLDPRAVNELFEEMPSFEAYHSMLDEERDVTQERKSEHLKNLRMLFRFARLQGSPVDEVLRNGGVDMEQIVDVNFDNILDMIETDREFRWRLFEELIENSEKVKLNVVSQQVFPFYFSYHCWYLYLCWFLYLLSKSNTFNF